MFSVKEYIQEYHDWQTTNYVGLAGFTMLVYDHIITFEDEVKYIWKAKDKTKIILWLFFINRYLTPFGFIINLNAFLSPAWSSSVCQHFVAYEGVMGFIGVAIASLMMIVRVNAIYYGNQYVMTLIWILFLTMVGFHAWLFTTVGPVNHPGIPGCSMLFGVKHKIGFWVSATAWAPLCFDTAVIILVILRTQSIVRAKIASQSKVVTLLIRDGAMYFSVILAVNLVLAIMIVSSRDGLKNICAQLQLLLTVTMMSRITLNLRKNMDTESEIPVHHVEIPLSDHSRVDRQISGVQYPPQALTRFGLHYVSNP